MYLLVHHVIHMVYQEFDWQPIMNNGIIPSIGLNGLFTLARELDTYYKKDTAYTVKSVRRIEDIIQSGQDVFADFYEPLGYTSERVASDAMVNACIVGLVTSTGQWIHVPSTAILAMPDESGVKYTAMAIGVDIGPVNAGYDLQPLKDKIAEQVKGYLGVNAEITEMAIGETVHLSYDDHVAVLANRQLNRTRSDTDGATILALQNLVAQLQAKNNELEAYIIRNKDALGLL